jgi:DNA-binding protein HU-beta
MPVEKSHPFLGNIRIFAALDIANAAILGHPTLAIIDIASRRRMMTQSQVAAHLADKAKISKRDAKTTLEELTNLVVRELKKEGSLRLAGLGIFRKRKSKARMGRNPATGEQIKIPARTRLRFTPAKALKDAVLGAR